MRDGQADRGHPERRSSTDRSRSSQVMKPMRLPLTTIALFVTLAVAPALAQTYYAIKGAGLELCGAWTEARQQNEAEVPEHWLLGLPQDWGSGGYRRYR